MKETINKIRQSLSHDYSKGEIDSFIRIIFENLLNYTPVDIIMHKDSILSEYIKSKINHIIDELLSHRPIQYIFGNTQFYGRKFDVDSYTLIPRPETEALIDIICAQNKASDLSIIDIGTGSGCIAISLALSLKFPIVTAIDISENALKVAKQNAKRLKANVNFILADIFKLDIPKTPIYDIIVSNPPYICEWEKAEMDSNVLEYEPHLALFVDDSEPLKFYSAIAEYALTALKPNGTLYFEINNRYADLTSEMLKVKGYEDITIIKDYHALPRFISAKKKNE